MPKHSGRSGQRWRRLVANLRMQGNPCGICGQPIDYSLRSPDPNAFEPDHITPWSLDERLREDPGNLRASHVRCNRGRGNSADLPGLGLRSRDW